MDLYLILSKREWEQVKDLEFYGEEVLKHEEFIHCATLDTYEWVINVFYGGESELVIAVFDSELISSPIKYETARRHPGLFPHVYGPMNMSALKYTKNFVK